MCLCFHLSRCSKSDDCLGRWPAEIQWIGRAANSKQKTIWKCALPGFSGTTPPKNSVRQCGRRCPRGGDLMKSHGVDTKTAAFGLHVVEILFFNRGFGLAHRISKATHGSNFNRNQQWSNGPNADRFDSYTRYLATLGEQKLQQAMNTVRTNWKTGED